MKSQYVFKYYRKCFWYATCKLLYPGALLKWKLSLQCNGFDLELQNSKNVSNQLHTND